jgi:hypothetical protein
MLACRRQQQRYVFLVEQAEAVKCGHLLILRFASTEPVTAAENIGILNSQREKRPMSPHLAIYEKQVC